MNKTGLVIASVLKPVNDTRSFEKIALSLEKTNKYEINIIGFQAKNLPSPCAIKFFPLFDFQRLSVRRWLAPFRYFRKLLALKPEVIIVSTHELLWASCCYRWVFGAKLIYDVQENYFANIYYQRNFPAPFRWVLAYYVRWKERFLARWIGAFLLAEDSYERELRFPMDRTRVIRNTYKGKMKEGVSAKPGGPYAFHFSGTLSKETGVIRAIGLYQQVKATMPSSTMTIIGYAPDPGFLQSLMKLIEPDQSIKLIGGQQPVPHQEILATMGSASIGLVTYTHNPSIDHCFPTKIYEYMAHQVVMLVERDRYWTPFCLKHQAAVAVSLDDFDPDDCIRQLKEQRFYSDGIPDEIYWEFRDEGVLIEVIERWLSNRNIDFICPQSHAFITFQRINQAGILRPQAGPASAF